MMPCSERTSANGLVGGPGKHHTALGGQTRGWGNVVDVGVRVCAHLAGDTSGFVGIQQPVNQGAGRVAHARHALLELRPGEERGGDGCMVLYPER